MSGTEGEVVYTRDLSSGKVHKRVRQGERLLVDERCNLDQAGAFEIVDPDNAGDFTCGHCFPDQPAPDAD
jgi:hypothetical protein